MKKLFSVLFVLVLSFSLVPGVVNANPGDLYVDDDAIADATVLSYTDATKTLVATTAAFIGYDEGDALEFISGTADKWVTRIESISDNDTAVLVDAYGSDFTGGTFNLVDLDGPSSADPFRYIQSGITIASAGDTIIVAAGTYAPFKVESFTGPLTIKAAGDVTVQGSLTVYAGDLVVLVKNSTNISLEGLNIQGQGLGGAWRYGVVYADATGTIKDCTVSSNTIGHMGGFGISIARSDVTVNRSTIENFGRVGIHVKGASIVEIYDTTIIGQVYDATDKRNYGIEVEAVPIGWGDPTPPHVTIKDSEIYNCDNTDPSAGVGQSAGIYINGFLEFMEQADSTVIMERNDIHDNFDGIYVVKSPSSSANFNDIYNNREYGVVSRPAHDGTTADFDATNNWWGDVSGPYHPMLNPAGEGDAVSNDVLFDPWLVLLDIKIDIKPGSDPNSINLKSEGVIPVAILTTSTDDGESVTFDATTVDWTTVKFGPEETEPVHDLNDPEVLANHQQDVDGDGDIDFVFHFNTEDTGIEAGDTDATLIGASDLGLPIQGTDTVNIVSN